MKSLVKSEYSGHHISFDEGAWFNATEAASFYGKKPIEWLRLPETERYVAALCEFHKVGKSHFIKTRRGKNVGGTWFHPKLAIAFARWCDTTFAIWCDDQISNILRGTHPHYDWKRMRSEAASSFKVMNSALQLVREHQGKATVGYHFANEARLVNFALNGIFAGIERDGLSEPELNMLARLEVRNAVLVAQGFDFQTRKAALQVFAVEQRGRIIATEKPALAAVNG